MLGRFELRRELGRGGFGVVHLAFDPLLGREVALKVPHAQIFADPDLHSRFQRKARAAAGLNHPHIVPVYEAGEVDSVGYIALAYCPGINLHDWLRRRIDSVSGPAIAEFMATLAGAIHHAARAGDHPPRSQAGQRPLKSKVRSPRSKVGLAINLGSLDLGLWTPLITDFGLAKQLDSELTQTHTGTIAGTPCYMAPEQTGRGERGIGPATDVYSLGAILYELLTGRAPFQGETVLDTLVQVRHLDPIPPRKLRPGVPRDLETICLKCLEKDPARRVCVGPGPGGRSAPLPGRPFDCGAAHGPLDPGGQMGQAPPRGRRAGRRQRAWRWPCSWAATFTSAKRTAKSRGPCG